MVLGRLSLDFSRDADHKGTVRDLHALSDKAASRDDAKITDFHIVEDGGPHADENVIADASTVEDGPVTDEDPVPDNRVADARPGGARVNDTIVFHGGIAADGDAAEISPDHGAGPNIGIFTENMVIVSDFIREGALSGIERALAEPDGLPRMDELARKIRVIPLSGTPLFERHFLEQMDFPTL